MKILAFETTDAVASVALYLDGEVFVSVIDTDRRHAESVLPAAEALLSAHGFTTADMDSPAYGSASVRRMRSAQPTGNR